MCKWEIRCLIDLLRLGTLFWFKFVIQVVKTSKTTIYLLCSTQDTRVWVDKLVRLCWRIVWFTGWAPRIVHILIGVLLSNHKVFIRYHFNIVCMSVSPLKSWLWEGSSMIMSCICMSSACTSWNNYLRYFCPILTIFLALVINFILSFLIVRILPL